MANDLKKGAAAKTQRPERMSFENEDKYPYHCTACGKGYMRQKDNFNVTPSPYYAKNGGYLTICRRCLDKSFEYYRDDVFDGDQDKAMELALLSTLALMRWRGRMQRNTRLPIEVR